MGDDSRDTDGAAAAAAAAKNHESSERSDSHHDNDHPFGDAMEDPFMDFEEAVFDDDDDDDVIFEEEGEDEEEFDEFDEEIIELTEHDEHYEDEEEDEDEWVEESARMDTMGVSDRTGDYVPTLAPPPSTHHSSPTRNDEEDRTYHTQEGDYSNTSTSFDFDLGSFRFSQHQHATMEEAAIPTQGYEQACREILQELQYSSDEIDDTLHRCDLPQLYPHLLHQQTAARKKQQKQQQQQQQQQQANTTTTSSDATPKDSSQKPPSVPTPIIPWLERNADDPDDYEYACHRLVAMLYGDDPDMSVETFLRRSTPKDLFQYLKREYWFLEHMGRLPPTATVLNNNNNETTTTTPEHDMDSNDDTTSTPKAPPTSLQVVMKTIQQDAEKGVPPVPPELIAAIVQTSSSTTPAAPDAEADEDLEKSSQRLEVSVTSLALTLEKRVQQEQASPLQKQESFVSEPPMAMEEYGSEDQPSQERQDSFVMEPPLEDDDDMAGDKDVKRPVLQNRQDSFVMGPPPEDDDMAVANDDASKSSFVATPPEEEEDSRHNGNPLTNSHAMKEEDADDAFEDQPPISPHEDVPMVVEDDEDNSSFVEGSPETEGDRSTSNHQENKSNAARDGVEDDNNEEEMDFRQTLQPIRNSPIGSPKRAVASTLSQNQDEELPTKKPKFEHESAVVVLYDLDESNLAVIIEDEVLAIVEEVERDELGENEPMDEDIVEWLIEAALEIVYRKKYYDVMQDRMIYLPPTIQTILDYSLMDTAMALQLGSTRKNDDDEDEEEFPSEYAAALRSVAGRHMEDIDLDFDYMDKLATEFQPQPKVETQTLTPEATSGTPKKPERLVSIESLDTDQLFDPQSHEPPPEKPLLAAAMKARAEMDDGGPAHLRGTNQPKRAFSTRSLEQSELFDPKSNEPSSDKPLLEAAMKARKAMDDGGPEHLRGANQPKRALSMRSIGDNEIFDPPSNAESSDKPLLEAAIKARKAMDDGPEHLRGVHQPTRALSAVSLDEDELFDDSAAASKPPEKPLLAAALKARKDMDEGPEHLRGVHQPKRALSLRSLAENEVFDPPSQVYLYEKPLLAAAMKARKEMDDGGPVHLRGVHQPNRTLSTRSLKENELFEEQKEMYTPDEKPLLTAAMKARKTIDDGGPEHLRGVHQPKRSFSIRSLEDNDVFDPLSELDSSDNPMLVAAMKARAEIDDGGPKHLRGVYQPRRALSTRSLENDELFDESSPTSTATEKPLLAAAIKARKDMDDGPDHLRGIYQPKRSLSMRSLGDTDVFDPSTNELPSEKPMLLAAMKARKSMDDGGPVHLRGVHQPKRALSSRSLSEDELFDEQKGTSTHDEKPLLTAAMKARKALDSGPEHLKGVHQPRRALSTRSLSENDLFDDQPLSPPPEKRLLAAALKARDNINDGSPAHLRHIHQPSRKLSTRSLSENEIFDASTTVPPQNKPLLAAALKARAEMEKNVRNVQQQPNRALSMESVAENELFDPQLTQSNATGHENPLLVTTLKAKAALEQSSTDDSGTEQDDSMIESTDAVKVSHKGATRGGPSILTEEARGPVMSSSIAKLFDLDESNLHTIITDEMKAIIDEAEKEELDQEPMDEEIVEILIEAAKQVVYRKKYYDVYEDRMVYLPPSIQVILDYSLLDIAKKDYSNDPDDFPIAYSAALRSVAARHVAEIDLDFEYISKLATDIELTDSRSNGPETIINVSDSGSNVDLSDISNDVGQPTNLSSPPPPVNNEKAQILEFKRRADKARLAKMADDLLTLRRETDEKRATEMKRLEEALQSEMEEIESSTSALRTKYMSDKAALEDRLATLELTYEAEDAKIEDRLAELSSKGYQADPATSEESDALEEKLLLSTKREQLLFDKLESARSMLAAEKIKFDSSLQEADESAGQGKGNLFGVFGRRKQQDLEKEKEKQAKLMQWKLREMELEQLVKHADEEHSSAKEELTMIDLALQQFRSQSSSGETEDTSKHSHELSKLEDQRRMLLSHFESEKGRIQTQILEVDEVHDQDIAWSTEEKNDATNRYIEGLQDLEIEIQNKKLAASAIEDKIRDQAMNMRNKWLAEEAELASNDQKSEKVHPRQMNQSDAPASVGDNELDKKSRQTAEEQSNLAAIDEAIPEAGPEDMAIADAKLKSEKQANIESMEEASQEKTKAEDEEMVTNAKVDAEEKLRDKSADHTRMESEQATLEANEKTTVDATEQSRMEVKNAGLTIKKKAGMEAEDLATQNSKLDAEQADFDADKQTRADAAEQDRLISEENTKVEAEKARMEDNNEKRTLESALRDIVLDPESLHESWQRTAEASNSSNRDIVIDPQSLAETMGKEDDRKADAAVTALKAKIAAQVALELSEKESSHSRGMNVSDHASPKRKPKAGGGLASRLLSEAHSFVNKNESSLQESFNASFQDMASGTEAAFQSKVLILKTSTPTTRSQEVNQERALVILRSKKIVFDQVDGSDPVHKDLRSTLFDISGKRGVYPQFFVKDTTGVYCFVGDFDDFEIANENNELVFLLEKAAGDSITKADVQLSQPNEGPSHTETEGDVHTPMLKSLSRDTNRKDSLSSSSQSEQKNTAANATTPTIGNVRKSIANFNSPQEKAAITGQDRAASWAKDNVYDRKDNDAGNAWDPSRLESWRQHGKRLVQEKRGAAAVSKPVEAPSVGPSSPPSSLAEKRRQIAERRQKALAARSKSGNRLTATTSRPSQQLRSTGTSRPSTGAKESDTGDNKKFEVGKEKETNADSPARTTLEEKRKRAAEARARAIATRGGPTAPGEEIEVVDKNREKGTTTGQPDSSPEIKPGDIPNYESPVTSDPRQLKTDNKESATENGVDPVSAQVQQAQALVISIAEQEVELQTLCRSLLETAKQSPPSNSSVAVLWQHVSQQAWFQANVSSSPLPTPSSFVAVEAAASSTSNPIVNMGADDENTIIQLTPLAESFIAMDGPFGGGDLCRLLVSIQRQTDANDDRLCNLAMLQQHWEQLSTLSGDPQSLRIASRLKDLVVTCQQANLLMSMAMTK